MYWKIKTGKKKGASARPRRRLAAVLGDRDRARRQRCCLYDRLSSDIQHY